MRFAESALLRKWGVVEIILLNAQAGSDVIADKAEPRELLGGEDGAGLGFVHEPFVKALADRVSEGGEDGLLFQGEADESDEVGEASGLGAALHFRRSGDGEGVP